MRYEMMYPDQIRAAIDENWPVVLAAGVLEYHAEHNVVGVDTIVINKTLEKIQKEMDIVILPPFYYGSASYAVSPPERSGTVHVDSSVVHSFAKELFTSLLRIGFKNIHVLVHHQSENFANGGMPTDLAFRLAGRQAIFEGIEKSRGEGWWGKAEMNDYYDDLKKNDKPFSWIQVHPFRSPDIQKPFSGDHAGLNETSLMMSLCPEGVDMSKFSSESWYAADARGASKEYGDKYAELIFERLRHLFIK